MPPLVLGAPAPMFEAPSHSTPKFVASSLGGRYVLLGFLPDDPQARAAAVAAVEQNAALFNDARFVVFLLTADQAFFALQSDRPGRRWFFDAEHRIAELYDVSPEPGDEVQRWVLLDPSLRVFGRWSAVGTQRMFEQLRRLPSVDDHAGTPLHAPVLIVPRVFEPEFCRKLIAYYEEKGGTPSGVMRQEGGRTVGVLDDFKKRADCTLVEESWRTELRSRLRLRLLPQIEKAYQFTATRVERYIVACYDAESGGYFRPHRDNTTAGTAHRQFAVSINLNAEEFEGGDLRFPEFGWKTYRPPTGGAVVFSCSLLHEATAVTRGKRYAFLPFLYNEAGEAIRLKNAAALEAAGAPEPAASAG